YAGFKTDVEIAKLPLSYLTGAIHDYATIRKGTLSGKGLIEYAPKMKQINLDDVKVASADIDYTMTKSNAAESKEMKQKTVQKAKEVSNEPGVELRAKNVRLTDSTLGWVDKTATPNYRVYFSDLDVGVKDFSNQPKEGIGTVDAQGKFLGSGPSTLTAKFHPQTKSPNFDMSVRI